MMMKDDFSDVWKIPKYRRWILFLVILLCLLFYFLLGDAFKKFYYQGFYGRQASVESYTDYLNEPLQGDLEKARAYNMSKDNMELNMKALASYKFYGMIADKIVHGKDTEETKPKEGETKNYITQIAPFDFLLAWGPFAKKDFLEKYDFKIAKGKAGPQKDISDNDEVLKEAGRLNPQRSKHYFSENFVIPANDKIYRVLEAIRPYSNIYIEGYLVSFEGKETDKKSGKETSFARTSSLTRNDEGPDAAEIIYVYKVILNGYEYK